MQTNRRNFIKRSSLAMAGAGILGSKLNAQPSPDTINDEIRIKEYRRLGRTEFMVSDIGCGMPVIQDENFLKSIIRRGVNYLDTAYIYQNGNNERMIGRAIKDFDRESLFITTKFMVEENMTVDDIIAKGKAALERLDSGYIDCIQLHNPTTVAEVRNPSFRKAIERQKKSSESQASMILLLP